MIGEIRAGCRCNHHSSTVSGVVFLAAASDATMRSVACSAVVCARPLYRPCASDPHACKRIPFA